jgi:transcriptional regulator with XRE-family HTH domain
LDWQLKKGVTDLEFSEKLQELRKNKNLTQEQLAEQLYVSRTAISKWESGRGYPSIDSLKEISKYFAISLDDLLSSEEILTVAQEDSKQKIHHFRDLVFGLLDCSIATFLFLPLFAQKIGDVIEEASLLSLTRIEPYVKIPYMMIVVGLIICGVLTLALQNCTSPLWVNIKSKLSLCLSTICALFFIISLQPYAAVFTFLFLAIKALMLIKWA